VAVTGVAAVAIALTGGLVLALHHGGSPDAAARVAALTRPSALILSPARAAQFQPITLTNTGRARLPWTASASAPWLQVRPDHGVLGTAGAVALTLAADPSAPEGAHDVSVTVTGSDGSSVAAVDRVDVEHAPTVGATVQGCTVRAMVVDDGQVSAVVLHWQALGQAEEAAALSAVGDGSDGGAYAGLLPGAVAVRWWVTATDGRSNLARTGDVLHPAGSC
jgi:hypothetical protein